MENHPIDPVFNIQTIVDPDTGNVTQVTIETSQPLLLYQGQEPSDQRAEGWIEQYVPNTCDLHVWGDQVMVFGEILMPGRTVEIFARTVLAPPGTEPGDEYPTLDVSGAEPEDPKDQLPVSADWIPTDSVPAPRERVKNGKGENGTDGIPFRELYTDGKDAGPGQSPEDENDERMHGQDGQPGAEGNRGGNITIACGRIMRSKERPHRHLCLLANGGKGQDGQQGQDGAAGGDGGPGAGPGKLIMGHATHPRPGGPGGTGGNGGKGGRGGKGGDGGQVEVMCLNPVMAGDCEDLTGGGRGGNPGDGGAQGVGGKGGPGGKERGLYGHNAPDGDDGDDGLPGEKADPTPQSVPGKATFMDSLHHASLAQSCRVTQLQMMFEAARARYFAINPWEQDEATQNAMQEIGETLDWIDRLLVHYPDDAPDKDLATALDLSVLALSQNKNSGLDLFGKTPAYMPALSLGTLQAALDKALEHLEKAEQEHLAYFKALKDAESAGESLQHAHQSISQRQGYIENEMEKTVDTLKKLKSEIDKAEAARKADKEKLKDRLKKFKDSIQAAFGLSAQTFFNCLSQLAFIGETPFNAGAMVVSQAGTALLEASTKVQTDSGISLDKNYVLGEIKKIDAKTGEALRGEFLKMADGTIDDTSSYKLLVQLDALRELVEQFRDGTEGASEAAEAIDRHIDLVAYRNRVIGFYNEASRRMVDLGGELARCRKQLAQYDGQRAEGLARLPAMTALVSGFYERARFECIREIYLARRSYAFWMLEPYDSFYRSLGKNPSALGHAALKDLADTIGSDLLTRLNDVRASRNWFPSKSAGDNALGVLVVMTEATHPKVFKHLRTNCHVDFEILPSQRDSKAPGRPTDPACDAAHHYSPIFGRGGMQGDSGELRNPFHGKANVRITRVQPWLVGMKTSGAHEVHIAHLGYERFRSADDQPFPAGEGSDAYLEHAPLTKVVRYNPEEMSYDSQTGNFTPGTFKGLPDMEDGQLDGLDLRSGGTLEKLPTEGAYAPIGPFGRWRISAKPADNGVETDLDSMLRNLTAIVIDFHGFSESFND